MRGLLRLTACLACAFALPGVGSGQASDFHGIAFLKGCSSPVQVGSPYSWPGGILNIVATPHDTLRVTGLTDVVNTAGGPVSSGSILSATQLIFNGPVTCTGGGGAGTAADPYVGATSCLIPYGASIDSGPLVTCTVQAADGTLPSQRLNDTATITWNNTCVAGGAGCTTGPQTASGSSSVVIGNGNQGSAFHGINFTVICDTPAPVGSRNLCIY